MSATTTALLEPATSRSVSKVSLLTVPTHTELLDQGLTDPVVMDVHELAPIVIAGFATLRKYVPYIKTFIQKCEGLPRDSKNRWREPVEGCYSLKEFFQTKCLRTPQAVYDQIRRAEQAEQELPIRNAQIPSTCPEPYTNKDLDTLENAVLKLPENPILDDAAKNPYEPPAPNASSSKPADTAGQSRLKAVQTEWASVRNDGIGKITVTASSVGSGVETSFGRFDLLLSGISKPMLDKLRKVISECQ